MGRDVRRATWGVTIMLAGVFLLMVQFDALPFWLDDYVWWGGLVVFLGLVTLVTARHAESVGSGITIILLGIWFLLVTNHLFGLRWYNSWPLALVSAGAGTVAHAIAANWLPDTKRSRRRRHDFEEAGHA